MGSTTNVTSSPVPLSLLVLSKTSVPCQKAALFSKEDIQRVDKTEASEQNGTFCQFPPPDSVQQPADCWEAAVRSGASSNPRVRPRCAGPQPDLLLHHTGDDLGHPVYREDREGMPPGADPEVPPSLSDGLQELLSNCQQTGVQPTVQTGVAALHRDRVQ